MTGKPLTADQTNAILALRKQGLLYREIADKLGISQSCVGYTVRFELRGPYERENMRERRRLERAAKGAPERRAPADRVEIQEGPRCQGCGLLLPCLDCPSSVARFTSTGTSNLGEMARRG